MLSGGTPARGFGALRGGCDIVGLQFTTASEVVSAVSGKGQTGFSLGNFATGVAVLTFPKSLGFLTGFGNPDDGNSTPATRQNLIVRDVNLTAGTANVKCEDAATGVIEAIANGTHKLVLFVGE